MTKLILNIGTQLDCDNGTFTVDRIFAKREKDQLGNIRLIPVITAKQGKNVISFTGPEIEEMLGL
jgi:hypothetical protein